MVHASISLVPHAKMASYSYTLILLQKIGHKETALFIAKGRARPKKQKK